MDQASKADDIVDLGEDHHKAGRLEAAESCYRKALEIDPSHPGALYFLANIACEDGRLPLATQLTETLLLSEPNDVEAWHLLGVIALKENKTPKAIEFLNKALASRPEYFQAHCSLGDALTERCDFDGAIACYRQAIELKADFSPAYAGIGQIFLAQEKWLEAVTVFRDAIANNAVSAEIRDGLEAAQLFGNGGATSNQHGEFTAGFERKIVLDRNEVAMYSPLVGANFKRPDELLSELLEEAENKHIERIVGANVVMTQASPSFRAAQTERPTRAYKVPVLPGFERHYADYRYAPSRFADKNVVTIDGHDVRILSRHKEPEIIVFGNILNDAECDLLMELSRPRLRPAPTFDRSSASGKGKLSAERTSEGAGFLRGESALIGAIETRLAKLLNAPIENGEELNILHYVTGAEYRPHYDFFAPEDSSSAVYLQDGGQRIATCIMYLNDVESGGETIFPEIDFTVTPRKGCAVYFSYFDAQGRLDRLSLHGGAPVMRGEKWIATKWIRQRGYRVGG